MSMMTTLTKSGHQPNLHTIYNEASSSIKQGLINNNTKYQLVTIQLHRLNEAERSIQTLNTHFITCICAANTKYTTKEWDSLLPQATLTLNILRKCHFNPKLSVYAAKYGMFDYKKNTACPTWNQRPSPR